LLAFSCLTGCLPAAADVGYLRGFLAGRVADQVALEKRFDSHLDRTDIRNWLKQMSAEPNHVGSPHNKANANFTLAKFQEWGWDAHIETFYILYPTPRSHRLELLGPSPFVARLLEPPVTGDETSSRTENALPPYAVYGADGDVTGELVYVNYGMPDDYKILAERGISVRGCIVIARYGGGWRGLKPKLAYEHGAVGCIIYSDPRDDGYGAGEVYPEGGYRPSDGVQRGSVLDMPVYPGDPLTPGYGSTKDAPRLALVDAPTVLKIPVMPISYGDAQPLLAAIAGPVAPVDWRGGLPITYRLGPGPAKVRLSITSDWSQQPIYNVIATLKGAEYPDQWIIRGNHRDAWVFGAWDPLSGHAAMLAEAQSLGRLVQQGWRPKRTLVYASWDAEEPCLIGSTEWVEAHAEELARKAVVYINSDTNTRGFLRAGGSPSLQSLVAEVAASVRDPQLPVSVLERLRAKLLVEGSRPGATESQRAIAKYAATEPTVPLVPLGAGTDFTAFLDHLGIAVLNIEYGGEDHVAGIYHSVYDSFAHYERFGDPGYHYGVALAQTIGRIVLRMADADVPPFTYGIMADTVGAYVNEVQALLASLRATHENTNRLLDGNVQVVAADPTLSFVPPARGVIVPDLDFSSLDQAVLRLKGSARACDEAIAGSFTGGRPLAQTRLAELSSLLQGMERELTYAAGLPGRGWYRHMIYAPGLLTGYGVKTLPGVREAIEESRWSDAEQYTRIVAGVLVKYADRLDRATRLLVSPATQN